MSAPTVKLVRSRYSLANDPATGLPRSGEGEVDIYSMVWRDRWHVEWEIFAGPVRREVLAWGRTRTKIAARLKAKAAAHRPGIADGGTR